MWFGNKQCAGPARAGESSQATGFGVAVLPCLRTTKDTAAPTRRFRHGCSGPPYRRPASSGPGVRSRGWGGRSLGHAPGDAPRPLCPLKLSQSARPAALANTFPRRAICDSESPNTFSLLVTTIGRMASRASHGGGGDGHHGALGFGVGLGADDGDAAAAVVPALDISPGQRRSLGTPHPPSERSHQGQVKLAPLSGLLGRLNAAAAATGLDGGEGAGL